MCECEFWEEPKINERIKELAEKAGIYKLDLSDETEYWIIEKFAELIVRECAELNRHHARELLGVITDVEQGDGFDDVCLTTVKRVAQHLANDVKEHFGVEQNVNETLRNRSTYSGNDI